MLQHTPAQAVALDMLEEARRECVRLRCITMVFFGLHFLSGLTILALSLGLELSKDGQRGLAVLASFCLVGMFAAAGSMLEDTPRYVPATTGKHIVFNIYKLNATPNLDADIMMRLTKCINTKASHRRFGAIISAVMLFSIVAAVPLRFLLT